MKFCLQDVVFISITSMAVGKNQHHQWISPKMKCNYKVKYLKTLFTSNQVTTVLMR